MLSLLPSFIRKKLFVVFGLTTRAMTLGVRIIVHNEHQGVLLVRHTYLNGWHLPGGGVERNETMQQAAAKEVLEEAGLRLIEPLKIVHVYKNTKHSKFDHVALFTCTGWEEEGAWKPNAEIAELGFFKLENLPVDTTPSTRARLDEVFNGKPFDDYW